MRQKACLRNFLLSVVVLYGRAIFLNAPGVYSLKSESSIHRLNIYEDVNNEMSLFQQKNNVTKNSSADSGAKEAVVSIQRGTNTDDNTNNNYNNVDKNVDSQLQDRNAPDYVVKLRVCSWSSIDYCTKQEFHGRLMDLKRTEKLFDPVQTNLIEMLAPMSGERIADIGCGYGNTLFQISRLMSNGGLVMGIDNSKNLLNEATKTLNKNTPNPKVTVLFRKAEAEDLNRQIDSKFFGTFGGVVMKRVLIHSSTVPRIVGQLIRLIRIGGRVVIAEPDWASFKIDHPDRQTTRLVQQLFEKRIANPLAGRSLRRIFRDAGLVNLVLRAVPIVMTKPEDIKITESIDEFVKQGLLDQNVADKWLATAKELAARGAFLCTLTTYIVRGNRPAGELRPLPPKGVGRVNGGLSVISQKYTTLNDGNVDMDGGNAPARNAHDRQNGIRERRNGYNSRMEDNRNNQAGYNRFNRNNEQDYRYDRDDENDDYRRQSRYDDRGYSDNPESDDDEYDDEDDDAGYHGPARRSPGNHYNSRRRRYGPRRHSRGRRHEYPDRGQGGYGGHFDDRARYNYSPDRRRDRSNRNTHGQYNYNNAPEGSKRFSSRNTGPLLRGNVMGRHAPVLQPNRPAKRNGNPAINEFTYVNNDNNGTPRNTPTHLKTGATKSGNPAKEFAKKSKQNIVGTLSGDVLDGDADPDDKAGVVKLT